MKTYTSDIQIWKEVEKRLKKKKKEGYHPRIDLAMSCTEDGFSCSVYVGRKRCDCCKRKSDVLIGYENQYPKNKDIELCDACSKEFGKI